LRRLTPEPEIGEVDGDRDHAKQEQSEGEQYEYDGLAPLALPIQCTRSRLSPRHATSRSHETRK
jgi:hypothetical protein